MKVHCLFEQSGTFKNVLKEMGFNAFDYDLENQFGQTDYQLDLFAEIENAYQNKKSIFDNFSSKDLIFAFFPCTYFSTQNNLFWNGTAIQLKNLSPSDKEKVIKERKKERNFNYSMIKKLVSVVKKRKLQLIIENPYHNNFLLSTEEFSVPDVTINDRRLLGDYFKKPTMFYFYNLEPTTFNLNFIVENNALKFGITDVKSQIERSLMHPTFAKNFVNKYIFGI